MAMRSRFGMAGVLLLASSCSNPNGLEVRAVGQSLVKSTKPQSVRISEAKAHLALGNTALALEQFRIAAREDEQSIEALSGMATCYRALGRPELAQRQLELALAINPDDAVILGALADVLDVQSLGVKAAMVRAEIQAEPVQALASASTVEEVPQPFPSIDTAAAETIKPAAAPSATPIQFGQPTVAKSSSTSGPAPRHEAISISAPQASGRASPTATMKLSPAVPMQGATPVGKIIGQSVTVALAPVRKAAPTMATEASAGRIGPRLQRLTLGEVALTTSGSVRWAKIVPAVLPVAAHAQLRRAQAPSLRILNAARVHGLAGSARAMLVQRGWRAIEISDARHVRSMSLLYVPKSRARTAARLAAQFSFPVRLVPSKHDFVLVLGANASPKRARA